MFNTLSEHLFTCQSLLKERRRPPTGGLREAIEESLGRGFYSLVPWGEVENDPWSLCCFSFPLTEENDWLLLWEELPP